MLQGPIAFYTWDHRSWGSDLLPEVGEGGEARIEDEACEGEGRAQVRSGEDGVRRATCQTNRES